VTEGYPDYNKLKQAVIVGATGQIGNAVTLVFAREGYKIDRTWVTPDHPDATDPKSYENMPDVVHSAVYLPGLNIRKAAEELSFDEWKRVFSVNVDGAFHFAQALFPRMVRADGASLIFCSSIFTTHPYPETAAYAAAKGALEGLSRALAVEWGPQNIRVNCLRIGHLPKPLKTSVTSPHLLSRVSRSTPSGNLVDANDIARIVCALTESPSISGAVIDIDCAYPINRFPMRF